MQRFLGFFASKATKAPTSNNNNNNNNQSAQSSASQNSTAFKQFHLKNYSQSIGATVMSLPGSTFSIEQLKQEENRASISVSLDGLMIFFPKTCPNKNYINEVFTALNVEGVEHVVLEKDFDDGIHDGYLTILEQSHAYRFLKDICGIDDTGIGRLYGKVPFNMKSENKNFNYPGSMYYAKKSSSMDVISTFNDLEITQSATPQEIEIAKKNLIEIMSNLQETDLTDAWSKKLFTLVKQDDFAIADLEELLTCPLSQTIFKDPVCIAETGNIYERGLIEAHFKTSKLDPMTDNVAVSNTKNLETHALALSLSQIMRIVFPAIQQQECMTLK